MMSTAPQVNITRQRLGQLNWKGRRVMMRVTPTMYRKSACPRRVPVSSAEPPTSCSVASG